METLEQKIIRISKIPGLINWARQNFLRKDKTRSSLEKLANNRIQISLSPVYRLCAKVAYREMTYDEAYEKALSYEQYHRDSATQILPLFNEYISQNQIEAIKDFEGFSVPYPIGKSEEGRTLSIPVRPTFVTIRAGRLRPVFLLGWVDTPLDRHQCRLISAIIRRALLTQQDFLGCDAEIVTFPRLKFSTSRRRGGWLISNFQDYSDEELAQQFERYKTALAEVIAALHSEE